MRKERRGTNLKIKEDERKEERRKKKRVGEGEEEI
jgi:hypothetical protein